MARLQGETGASPTEMRTEIARMMATLEPLVDQMNDWEQRFMMSMADNLTSDEWVPTARQLFAMRDLNLKY
jgi:hypothetical protein